MLKFILVTTALLGLGAHGAETTYDLRLRISSSQPDALAPGIRFAGNFSDAWRWSTAAQVALSPKDLRHFVYQGALAYSPWTPLAVRLSLFHQILPGIGAGATGLLATLNGDGNLGAGFGIFGSFGWYERLSQASGAGLLPLPSSGAEREHDFAFRLGARAQLAEQWTTMVETASFDDYEVYNLNGPYFQVAVDHRPAEGELWRAFARYGLLLGFGRLNEFVVGGEVKLVQ